MYLIVRKNEKDFYYSECFGILRQNTREEKLIVFDSDYTNLILTDKNFYYRNSQESKNVYSTLKLFLLDADKSKWIKVNDNYYYFNNDYKAVSGLVEIDGRNYYFNPETKIRAKGVTEVDDKYYFFGIKYGYMMYGEINYNGNIFVVNPAGVQIGPSAQINVGSLYVSSNTLADNDITNFYNNAHNDNFVLGGARNADAALMSLGNINATNVTFEGDGRIVIDSERIKNENTNLTADEIFINTNDKNNVVIGYEAYENGSYAGVDKTEELATLNGFAKLTKADGYMWVEDVEQLQAINTNLGGNYALRNSIDATSTDDGGAGFKPIGLNENGKVKDTGFTGKFDGIDYNIFGLTINNDYTNVGLFGETNGATINNVTLVGGSVTGAAHVGAVVGSALNGTVISNVINSASVNGIDGTNGNNIGGIVGVAYDTTITNAVNTGAVDGKNNNVGGLVGLLENGSTLNGNSYNLGDVSGTEANVGGLVGHAVNSTIGNPSVVNGKPVENVQVVYNRLDVEGAYNVGGIVGNMVGTIVQNAENSGNVTASGYDNGEYTFHTDYTVNNYSSNGIKTVDVNVANVGGIAGTASANSTITDVLNTANVSSKQQNNNDYYDAGNVGGIVGSAVDTNISNATNKENEVRGAHNVGGVAGYFSGAGRITGGINDGGDIMATGARYTTNGTTAVVTETIRKDYDATNNDGKYVIGNIGGIVGYMEGDYVHIDASGNRGTVHTLDISDGNNISDASEAANVGGIVGKIDRSRKITDKNELGEKYVNAAVSNSYNTGDVRGFTAIGGIAGMMYNGGIAGAYNLGEIRSTRVATGNETPLNMGGIVGDTTEVSNARAFIYDVYNKGKIGRIAEHRQAGGRQERTQRPRERSHYLHCERHVEQADCRHAVPVHLHGHDAPPEYREQTANPQFIRPDHLCDCEQTGNHRRDKGHHLFRRIILICK